MRAETRKRVWRFIRYDELLRHSLLLLVGFMVAHVLNTIYQMIVSRALSPEEYALLAAFLGGMLILHHPLYTLTTGISRYSSLLCQQGRTGDVKRLTHMWLLLTGSISLALSLLAWLFRVPLTSWLHLDRSGPIVAAALCLPPLFLLPVLRGTAQGIQRFDWNIAALIAGSGARVVLGSALVWFVFPTCGWALLGHGAGAAMSVMLLWLGMLFILHVKSPTTQALPRMRSFMLQALFVQCAYAILMTADVVLVKHFIPTHTEFAYAATLGRLAVFLPHGILVAMFPKVTAEGPGTKRQNTLFFQALTYTGLCTGAAVLIVMLFPGLLTRILFGIPDASASQRHLTIAMAAIMGVSALLNTCLQFLLAQHRLRPARLVPLLALAYLLTCWAFHNSVWQIVAWSALFNGTALLLLLSYCYRSAKRQS